MSGLDVNVILQTLSIWAVPVLMAITFHEAAHGYVAKYFGDDTAYMLGRVTLNPLKHIDPLGTVLMPLALVVIGLPALGYARPVPVNFRKVKPYKKGVALVAFAGPGMNFMLAVASLFVIVLAAQFSGQIAEFFMKMAWASVQINVLLMLFNMLPIPPLDGSRVLSVYLPARLSYNFDRVEPYGMWIVLALVVSGIMFAILSPMINFSLNLAQNVLRVIL